MDDKTAHRLGSMIEIDIDAFERSTPYSRLEIIKQMDQILHSFRLMEESKRGKEKI